MSENTPVSDKVDRVEAIIEQLEDGEVSLEEKNSVRKAKNSLLSLRGHLLSETER